MYWNVLTLIDWNWLPLKMILCILHFFWSFNYLAADCARARLKRQKWKICFCTSLMVRACSVQLKSLNPPHPSAVRSPRTAVNLFCSKMKLKVGVACVSEWSREMEMKMRDGKKSGKFESTNQGNGEKNLCQVPILVGIMCTNCRVSTILQLGVHVVKRWI